MKIAVLILCHKNPEQINLFLDVMRHPMFTFFLHIDKKSDITDQIVHRDDVIVLQDSCRINVQWGKFSQIEAILSLFHYSKKVDSFDFYWLCSGQDFPIKPVNEIAEWFERHPDKDFIRLFRSKNTGLKTENNYDKRNTIFFPNWILGNKRWKRIIKRLYTEITGYNGGKLKEMADYHMDAKIDNMQISEDLHMIFDHMMFYVLNHEEEQPHPTGC